MKRFLKTSFLASLLSLGALAAPAHAGDRSFLAFNGYPVNPAAASCFSQWYGAIINNCNTSQQWIMPIVADTSGQHDVQVTVGAGCGASVTCDAEGMDKNISQHSSSGMRSVTPGTTDIYLPVAIPQNQGFQFVYCNVGPHAQINGVNVF